MALRQYLIHLPSFSDFVYRSMVNSNATQRRELSDFEVKHFASESAMSKFCENAPLEHLLQVLTKIGVRWDIRTYESKQVADQIEFLAVNQYQHEDQRLDIVEKLLDNNAMYMTAENIMLSAYMCAQNTQSRVYQLSTEARHMAQRTKNLKKKKRTYEEDVEEAESALADLNLLLLNQLNTFDWVKQNLDLAQHELRVLAALFVKRTSAISMQDLMAMTLLEGSQAYLGKTLDGMVGKGIILSDLKHGPKLQVSKGKKSPKKTFYMISNLGIQKMMKYTMHMYELTFFKKW